jgi:hypothetical protein
MLYYTIIAWCNTAVSCPINLCTEKGAIWINGKRYPNPWIPVQLVTGKAHNLSVIQHPLLSILQYELSIAWLHASLVVTMQILSVIITLCSHTTKCFGRRIIINHSLILTWPLMWHAFHNPPFMQTGEEAQSVVTVCTIEDERYEWCCKITDSSLWRIQFNTGTCTDLLCLLQNHLQWMPMIKTVAWPKWHNSNLTVWETGTE